MKPPARITIQAISRLPLLPSRIAAPISCRAIHSSPSIPANVAPFSAAGPPPDPPLPAVEHYSSKIARRRRQAEMLRNAKAIRNVGSVKSAAKSPLKRRFWQDVHIKEVDGSYQVHLDTRPLRHPTTKTIVNIPLSKPHLAHAIALEWDLLTSAQQATKSHLIPMTSLVCRALDIAADDTVHSNNTSRSNEAFAPIRTNIATMLMRYLDTDSLLCWAPPPDELFDQATNSQGETLRSLQERAAGEIVGFLTSQVWPGVEIGPVLDGSSIMPKSQKPGVREVVQGWVMGLEPWDLAGLERATLAGKSLLSAVRMLVDWSEGRVGQSVFGDKTSRFGVEEAAKAVSLEVAWQTGRWGEVEDTHDVEKEDLRRQLGSVILLVSGTG